MGVMGMPTDEPGVHATWPPRVTGGNFDCKELVPGSTLYLPIQVPGGLFSVGDGHATQGDGEVSGVSIECPMERVTLTFSLNTYPDLDTPRARVPGGWLTFGLHRDLNEAAIIATNAMLDLMCGEYNLDRKDAINLASLVVDLRVTQIVNRQRAFTPFYRMVRSGESEGGKREKRKVKRGPARWGFSVSNHPLNRHLHRLWDTESDAHST
jgi:acetamidase/formamidase